MMLQYIKVIWIRVACQLLNLNDRKSQKYVKGNAKEPQLQLEPQWILTFKIWRKPAKKNIFEDCYLYLLLLMQICACYGGWEMTI